LKNPNILISSSGRRVGLIGCFRDAVALRGETRLIFTADAGLSAPSAHFGDGHTRVPRCTEPAFIDVMLALCAEKRVGLLIPTIDTELPAYADAHERFCAAGIVLNISTPATVRICCDKIATHAWLTAQGFPTVRQADIRTALDQPDSWPFPLIAKPFNGSASSGLHRIQNRRSLEALAGSSVDYIVQQIAPGREYTVNVYVDRSGKCVCAVPHLRLEIRAGEVSKGVTVKDRRLMDLAGAIATALPGAYGVLNVQCFMDDSGHIRIIEINARFGGGYPLAHRSGANFAAWLLEEQEGRSLALHENWQDGLAMLRYDEAVYLPEGRLFH
jgi:carbamoyl-phosphate synthase large subunit